MNDFLNQTFARLLDHTDLSFKRYLYDNFKPGRLTGVLGARGVGKTTLLLQYIKEHLSQGSKAFYFSADTVYFRQTTLLAFINELYNLEGYRQFFIDEIHKYKNWNQELKNIYDAFPDVQIIYSGSSTLELIKGSHDLSRRAKLYHLPGLSFREYINFVTKSDIESVSYADLLEHSKNTNKLGTIEMLMGHFKKYLAYGYYPFVFEDPSSYYERVIQIIDKIIFEDIPSIFDLKTQNLYLFKKIICYLASIPPGEVNMHNIAQNMQISHQTVSHYLNILAEVGLVQMIYPFESGNQYLRKPEKIFLHNSTLLFALEQFVGEGVNTGMLRELYFVQALRDAKQEIYYSKQGYYRTKDTVFEIGGKNKKLAQIANSTLRTVLVKDDIVMANHYSIPLSYFGFLY